MLSKKRVVPILALCSAAFFITPAHAYYSADIQYTHRTVHNVIASSIDIRTQPNEYSPLITTQSQGRNIVQTVPSSTTTSSASFSWLKVDYVSNSVGSYSDSYSGYGQIENLKTLTNLVESCNLVYNDTSTPNNWWKYSNLTQPIGTLASGGTYRGGWIYAADDNPNAWLMSYPDVASSTYAYMNGWFVDAYQKF